ncbi:CFEM domain-containing protein [Seiridium cupressi]
MVPSSGRHYRLSATRPAAARLGSDHPQFGGRTSELLESDRMLIQACEAAPRDVQRLIRGLAWALFGVTTIFVAGRLFTRSSYFGGAHLGLDDWAIVASYLIIIAVTLFYVAEFAYVIETTVTKFSILLLYLRIFPHQGLRKQIYCLMAVITMITVAFIISLFNYCKPFPYTWWRWDNQQHGKCDDINAQTFIHAGLNIVLDLVILFIPIPHILKLGLSTKKKVGIILIFIVGLFVTICSIVRLKYLVNWAFDPNPTMNYSNLAVWSFIELDVSVICACMPGMAALLRRLKQHSVEYMRSKSGYLSSHGVDGTPDPHQTITKTTVISVLRSRGGEAMENSSELQLVERPRWPEPPGYSNKDTERG